MVIDVRADDRIEDADIEAFAVTGEACALLGWEFRRVGELDAVWDANVRWLARYRHPRCAGRAEVTTRLREVLAAPTPLLAGVEAVGNRTMVLPAPFHLMLAPGVGGGSGVSTVGADDDGSRTRGDGRPRVSERARPRRPAGLSIGDRVRLDGVVRTVIAVSGTGVRLADTDGMVMDVGPAEAAAAEVVSVVSRSPAPSSDLLDNLPEDVAAEALWWEQHIVEVLREVPPQAPPGTTPEPEYDPERVSLTRREQAKAAELTRCGQTGDRERYRETVTPLRGRRCRRHGRSAHQ